MSSRWLGPLTEGRTRDTIWPGDFLTCTGLAKLTGLPEEEIKRRLDLRVNLRQSSSGDLLGCEAQIATRVFGDELVRQGWRLEE